MLPPRLLNGVQRSFTIECLLPSPSMERDLDQLPDSRKILRFVLPPWQREEVWTEKQQVSFCEGIFLGFGCGFLVVNGREWVGSDGTPAPMAGWLIDGQQRVAAIRNFFSGKLAVFGSIYWKDIPVQEQRRRFLSQPFHHLEIEYIADEPTLKALYTRLNRGGTAHTASDMARL